MQSLNYTDENLEKDLARTVDALAKTTKKPLC